MPEIHLGLNPTRKRTESTLVWRGIAEHMTESKHHETYMLGEFLLDSLLGCMRGDQVTIRVDDYHAKLIYDALPKKGKVKA